MVPPSAPSFFALQTTRHFASRGAKPRSARPPLVEPCASTGEPIVPPWAPSFFALQTTRHFASRGAKPRSGGHRWLNPARYSTDK